jgi:hypothetical protein
LHRLTLILCLVASSALAARGELPPAVLVDGKAITAKLLAVDAGWNVTLDTTAGRRTIPAADLVQWGTFSSATQGSQILLVGGGVISADIESIDKESLTADSDTFGKVKLPLELLSAVVVRLPLQSEPREQLEQRMFGERNVAAKTDRLLLENADELAGTLVGLKDGTYEFESAAGVVKLLEAKVAAIVFNPSLAAMPRAEGLRAWVGFKDGSRVIADKLALDLQQSVLAMLGGVELKPRSADVVALLPLAGRAHYLSDLKPESYHHVPYLGTTWPYYADRNVLGGPLRAGSRLYLKGLGLHSAAQLTYVLDQPYRRFETEVALDDQTAGRGSITLRIQVDDGAGGWRTKYESPVVRGGAAPVPVSVDIVGAKRIVLSVDFADRGDELDHADLLGARLVK